MYWQAMRVGPWLDHGALRAAFAEAFSLDPARIYVIEYPDLWQGPIPPEPRIMLECARHEGHSPLQLDAFLVGDEVERPVADLAGTLDRAQALAKRLCATLLFGTGPIEHCEEIRVAPNGAIDIVQLDWDNDDEHKLVILGSRPLTELPTEPVPASA
jgi:hypothetical protein